MARFTVSMFGENLTKELWTADNNPVRGQFLVVLDLVLDGADPEVGKNYESALVELSRIATARHDLTQFIWLFTTIEPLERTFQVLVNKLGVIHHNFSVVELASGKGLAYNAKKRVVYEIAAESA